jgi:hypothetical protein
MKRLVRQGPRFLRQQLPEILAKRIDVLSPRMIGIIEDLGGDWRRLDERIERVTEEIETAGTRERAATDDGSRHRRNDFIMPTISRVRPSSATDFIPVAAKRSLLRGAIAMVMKSL